MYKLACICQHRKRSLALRSLWKRLCCGLLQTKSPESSFRDSSQTEWALHQCVDWRSIEGLTGELLSPHASWGGVGGDRGSWAGPFGWAFGSVNFKAGIDLARWGAHPHWRENSDFWDAWGLQGHWACLETFCLSQWAGAALASSG